MRRTLFYIALFFTASLSACHPNDVGEAPIAKCVPEGACGDAMFVGGLSAALGDAAKGSATYQRDCARCHGADGKGLDDARHVDMTSPAWQLSLRDGTIVRTIRSGRPPTMPAFNFSDDELRNLLAHIRTLKATRVAPSSPIKPGDP